ncbi:MAG: hypothetical protein WDM76_17065 [Limisphaerales bacterium]
MGNPVGRLEIALNYLAENVQLLGKEESVEVIVTDWGSQVPLKDVLKLNATAAKITRFLEVPNAVVKEVQKDSPFAEVLALNAAARRASGEYIGRIDQDTLVGKHFLRIFFEWVDGKRNLGASLKTSYLFSKRRQIPFDFATHNLSLKYVKGFLALCGKCLLVEAHPPFFFNSPVGIMILSKDLWMKCGGYDERLIYWGWMEVDMAYRLKPEYRLLDIGPMVKYDFYHLEHYDPRLPRRTPRKMNPTHTENLEFNPNDEHWGLIEHAFPLCSCSEKAMEKRPDVSDAWKSWRIVFANIFEFFLNQLKYSFVGRGFCALGRPKKYLSYLKRTYHYVARRVN